ncbi:MAG: hypothetical protein N4A35_09335 [Flavobacteriales bacterium]|jgi:hypothetical protein|nr:hypothetical protein [Flavobacteriales bacterium]
MKNKFIQLGTLGLLALTIVTAESCRKEDPPAETISTGNANTNNNGNGSGNNNGGNNNTVNGCTDIDSPLYNASANTDDGSCQYAYTSGYEITYHLADDGGSDWDYGFGNSTRADLILKIKEQGSSNYLFEGDEITNQDPTAPATWAAPSATKLLNKTYEWELYDYDATSSDDLISSGTFNPITLASNGSIVTTAGGSQLKITYTLQ